MRLARYTPDLVDCDAKTSPLPIPEPYKSGPRHVVPDAPKVTKREVSTLLLAVIAAGGALIVGFESYHLWYLGGPEGAWLAAVTNGAAVALGASVVAMWRRR